MPYNLLFSRTIASDAPVRFTDVPITDKNVMIEILSLYSPFRRLAGYAYALRSDGITDYERSSGVTLPFGKNRVNFSAATVPYGLEFFPRLGVKSGILSVYLGEPGAPIPPGGEWKQAPTGPYQMRLNTSPNGASYRSNAGDAAVIPMMNGAVSSVMTGEFVYWKDGANVVQLTQIGLFTWSYIVEEAEYQSAIANGSNIVL